MCQTELYYDDCQSPRAPSFYIIRLRYVYLAPNRGARNLCTHTQTPETMNQYIIIDRTILPGLPMAKTPKSIKTDVPNKLYSLNYGAGSGI